MDASSAVSQVLGPAILAALQARLPADQVQVILAQAGQQLDLVLFAAEGGTVKLQLPPGQVFEADGSVLALGVGSRFEHDRGCHLASGAL